MRTLITLIFTSMFLCSCQSDYGHKLPLVGDVDISIDSKGNLCFAPLFETLRLDTTVGDHKDIINLKFLNMERIEINSKNQQKLGFKKILMQPSSNDYFILYDKQKTCINTVYDGLNQNVFAPFESGEELIVVIYGINDNKNDQYSTFFHKEFKYPMNK